jgi:hypothetical protein
MQNNIYGIEIEKLDKMLSKANANYDLHDAYDGYQIWLLDKDGNIIADAVCHSVSYGHTGGLLEIMGKGVKVKDDSVEGYLTARQVFNRWKAYI